MSLDRVAATVQQPLLTITPTWQDAVKLLQKAESRHHITTNDSTPKSTSVVVLGTSSVPLFHFGVNSILIIDCGVSLHTNYYSIRLIIHSDTGQAVELLCKYTPRYHHTTNDSILQSNHWIPRIPAVRYTQTPIAESSLNRSTNSQMLR